MAGIATSQSQPLPASKIAGDGNFSILDRISKPSAKLVALASCIYGRGGVGKTSLLATMPGKGLVLDIPQVEGGTFVLAESDNIDVFLIREWRDFDDAWKTLATLSHDYAWVAIDTVTAGQQLAKRKVVKERPQAIDIDPHSISLQDWGKIGELDGELYYRFALLTAPSKSYPNFKPMHVIYLAQEILKDTEETSREYQPAISPLSLSALLPRMALVGRMYTREADDGHGNTVIDRHLRVHPHGRALAKIRTLPSRPVPPVIRNPHLGRLFGYIMGAKVPPPEGAGPEESSVGIVELA